MSMTIENAAQLSRTKATSLDQQVNDLNAQASTLAAARDLHNKAAEALEAIDPSYKEAIDALLTEVATTPANPVNKEGTDVS